MSRGRGAAPRFESSQDAFELLTTLASAAELRDPFTKGHSGRVAFLANELAFELGLDPQLRRQIDRAARIHDIGKLCIGCELLLKPGPLSPVEWDQIKQHPSRGAEMLRLFPFFEELVPIVEGHHEHYDGGGYPRGLKGEQTTLGARILSVTDAYDALTSTRSYRPCFSHQEAIRIINKGAGKQWDPEVVAAFVRVVEGRGRRVVDLSAALTRRGK